jgi:hypothetical protein
MSKKIVVLATTTANISVTQIYIFLAAFGLASLGGLAALLRSGKPLCVRVVTAATLYSGLIGLTIALIWYNYFSGSDNIPFLLGVSTLAGVGGVTAMDLIKVLLEGKLKINIDLKQENNDKT